MQVKGRAVTGAFLLSILATRARKTFYHFSTQLDGTKRYREVRNELKNENLSINQYRATQNKTGRDG